MSSLFSDETKKRLEFDLLNQLCVPKLEPEATRQNHERLFSPSDLFAVLYGKTHLRQAKRETHVSQGNTKFMAAENQTVCDLCQGARPGGCPLHRQANQMQTNKVLPYAIKSLPPECKLSQSSAAGEGYGVYTNQNIPLGTWIGPYEGQRIRPSEVTPNMDTSHMWEIYDGATLSHYIDGSNENTASWMRFIRCARHKDEQNLYVFQYNGNIYYRAFKHIPFGTEMLVWYDENYPMYMGIPLGIQVDEVDETSNTPTITQFQHERKQGEAVQCNRSAKSVSSSSEIQDRNRFNITPNNTQVPQTKASVTSRNSKNSPTSPKNLPPLVPTFSLQQRRASVDSSISVQLSSASITDSENGSSNSINSMVHTPQRTVSELTSWKCQQCHKTFTQRVALQMHTCPSPPTKPFQCGQCSSTFNNSSELRAHVATHTTERPFKCGFCSRTFVGATTLNNHVRTHMGQKPFGCGKCGKTFSQAMHLAKHARESCKSASNSRGPDSVIQQAATS